MLRIAVQSKGRLNEDSMKLLEEVGVKVSVGKRQLLTRSNNFPAEILFLRDDDIPKSVADGIADLGIVGENEFVEKRADAKVIKKLGFSRCRLSLAIQKDAKYAGLEWFNGKNIATSYPEILSAFLTKNKINAKIFVITGSVEISPELGVADAIFDIVSSGSTLVAHHLTEVEVVMQSEAIIVANKQLTPEKEAIVDELLFRIAAVQEAENKKYILMNVPNEKIEEIVKILPGIKAPTIMPLVREGWSSLHTVLDEKCFWNIISQLKLHGAEGILVLPIEKMIL